MPGEKKLIFLPRTHHHSHRQPLVIKTAILIKGQLQRSKSDGWMTELINFVTVSIILIGIGVYGLIVKHNAIRMIFAIEIIANAANLNLIAFSRYLGDIQGQVFALFAIAIAAAEVAVGLAIIIIAYRLYKEIDVTEFKNLRG